MKYVVFEDDTPVIFPDWIEHVVVGTRLAPRCGRPVRAGFVRLVRGEDRIEDGIEAEVYGESISLELKSHPSDNARIEKVVNRS